MMAYEKTKVQHHLFLTSALDWVVNFTFRPLYIRKRYPVWTLVISCRSSLYRKIFIH